MKTKKIEYFDGDACLEGILSVDEKHSSPRPGVIIIHDWSGRNDHVIERAQWLAELGYVGFAADMYGKGILGTTNDEKAKLAGPFFEDRTLMAKRMQLILETLKQQPEVDENNIAAIGFCFGGMCVLDLVRAGADIKAAISFHGVLNPPPSGCVDHVKAKILALHGHDDPMVPPEQVLAFETEMTNAKADWQMHVYGQTTHAFTNKLANDPSFGTVYNATADKRSWQACQNLLAEVFGL